MANRQFTPSWIDWVIDWVESLPIPPLFFYILFYAFNVIVVHLAYWIGGDLTPGQLRSTFFFDVTWMPFFLGYLHLMKRTARQSVEEFRPALDISRSKFDKIKYEFTTLPFWPVLLLSIVGALGGILAFLNSLTDLSAGNIVWSVISGGGYTFLPVWLYASYRHITKINGLYKQVDNLNLFNLQPLYGLSRVAMLVGGFIIIIINMNYLWEVFLGTPSMSQETIILLSFVLLIFALAVIIAPIWGIHRRIEDKKRTMLAANAEQIVALEQSLQDDLKRKKFTNVDGIGKGLSALFSMRANIQAIPAWPWQPGAFRNFASAILLPLLIWLAQRILTQYF
ncbi:MAG: hypothetical protein WEC37_05185 [Anaerolineales bacterium]